VIISTLLLQASFLIHLEDRSSARPLPRPAAFSIAAQQLRHFSAAARNRCEWKQFFFSVVALLIHPATWNNVRLRLRIVLFLLQWLLPQHHHLGEAHPREFSVVADSSHA
jgi:hypothetical protein